MGVDGVKMRRTVFGQFVATLILHARNIWEGEAVGVICVILRPCYTCFI